MSCSAATALTEIATQLAQYAGARLSVHHEEASELAREIQAIADALRTQPLPPPTDEYPRVRPEVLRQRACEMNILASLIDRAGRMPLPEDLRWTACLMFAASEDLEDARPRWAPLRWARR